MPATRVVGGARSRAVTTLQTFAERAAPRRSAIHRSSRRYPPPVRDSKPVQKAAVRAASMAAAAAVGTGLSTGDWREAFLYAAVLSPVTFLVAWALLDHKQRG